LRFPAIDGIVEIGVEMEMTDLDKKEDNSTLWPPKREDENPIFLKLDSTFSLVLVGALLFIVLLSLLGYTLVFFHVRRRRMRAVPGVLRNST